MHFYFRSLGGVSSGSLSLSDFDFKPKELRITACGLSGYSDLWFDTSIHCINDGDWIYASDSILRCMRFVRSMHPMLIVPGLILVEFSLHSFG